MPGPSEKYIDRHLIARLKREPTSSTSFYTQQRIAEYKFLPEALKAQYSGMVESYKSEALRQMLPPELQEMSPSQLETYLQIQVESLVLSGVPLEEVEKWASEVREKYQQAQVQAQAYAEQRVRSETQLALLTAAGIGAFVISPATAIVGAGVGIAGVQAKAWKPPFQYPPTLKEKWLQPPEPPRTITVEEAVAAASLGAVLSVGIEKIGGYIYGKLSKTVTGKQIVGASEKEFAKATDQELGVIRETELETRYTTLPKQAKEFERFIYDTRISFAGKEYAIIKKGDEYIVGLAPYESTREADVFIQALKSEKATVTQKFFLGGMEFEPAAKMASRQITGVQMFGKIDPQVYLRFLKNVPAEMSQSWLKQMGGLSLPQLATLDKPIEVAISAIPIESTFTLAPSLLGGVTASKISNFIKVSIPTFKPSIPEKPIKPEKLEKSKREYISFPGIFEISDIDVEEWTAPETKEEVAATPAISQETNQLLKTSTKTLQTMQMPSVRIKISIPSFQNILRIPKARKRGKSLGLFGWYRWDYPILSPEKLLKGFGLNIERNRKGGKRGTRRKRRQNSLFSEFRLF
ncbi:MAG: hypothetical protein QXJ02_07145 [Candidatus Bathyarchaeia archaeon]